MNTYSYSAVDSQGKETKGALRVASQTEALRRIKEMGFYPTRIALSAPTHESSVAKRAERHVARLGLRSRAITRPADFELKGRIKTRRIAIFTRQLATLLDAGMPLLRSLRLLQEQETYPQLRKVVAGLAFAVESGGTFSEALGQYPRVFDRLYVNMIKAGELGGMLETCLQRLAEFMDKGQRIKGKIKAAMYYPVAVMTVAVGVVTLMTFYIIPKFKEVFDGLYPGRPLPAFTRFVLGITDAIRGHFLLGATVVAAMWVLFRVAILTDSGRGAYDLFKLKAPVLGPLLRKLSISRFTRTLGTLITSGVPILQALNIVKEATGNVIMGRLVGRVRDNVEQGESIVGPLRNSGIFPVMVAGMVDVGEQTGALPEMLNRIADNYDEEVDNSVAALTSLLEPLLIVFLGVVVGMIVVALFLLIIPPEGPGPNSEM